MLCAWYLDSYPSCYWLVLTFPMQVSSRASIRDTCEQFMYEKFKAKVKNSIFLYPLVFHDMYRWWRIEVFYLTCRLRCRLTRLWRRLCGWAWWSNFQPMVGRAWLVFHVQKHMRSWGAGGIACWNTGQSKVDYLMACYIGVLDCLMSEIICVFLQLMK